MLKCKLFLSLFLLSFLFWNCTKIDTTKIGAGIIPAVDNVHTFADTLSVIATNYDSTATTPLGYLGFDSLSRYRITVLGYIGNDPLFGKTTANMYFQLEPIGFPYTFAVPRDSMLRNSAGAAAFDSVVLVLHYVKTWGDSTQPQTVNLYQLNLAPSGVYDSSFFKFDSTFKTNDEPNPANIGSLLATQTFIPGNLHDTARSFMDTTVNQFRINLSSTSFAQKLYLQDTSATSANPGFANDSLYRTFFGGFALVSQPTGNSLSYFNLFDPGTKVAVYYTYHRYNALAFRQDTIHTVAYFKFVGNCGERNTVKRDHSGALINNYTGPAPAGGHDLIFIQTSPGTFATLKIPNLDTLNNRIIHRAELIVEQVVNNPVTDSLFSPPDYLQLEVDSSGTGNYRTIPCDYVVTNNVPGISTFGGNKTTITDAFGTRTRYVFNISRYVQNYVIHQRKNMRLRLSAPYHVIRNTLNTDECGITELPFNFGVNDAAQGRVMLGGGTHPNMKMRLHIVYSKL